MDSPLSQLDISSPDHVSVITRSGRVTISVRKDGADVTLGFPLSFKTVAFNAPASSKPASHAVVTELKQYTSKGPKQPVLQKKTYTNEQRLAMAKRFQSKLNDITARQIKDMLEDKDIMAKFGSNNQAYVQIGQAYGVSNHTIRSIHLGLSWKHI